MPCRNVSVVDEQGGAKQAYQCDVPRLVLDRVAPPFRVDELCSHWAEHDARKHCWESLTKVPYLLDLDRSKTVQYNEGAWWLLAEDRLCYNEGAVPRTAMTMLSSLRSRFGMSLSLAWSDDVWRTD